MDNLQNNYKIVVATPKTEEDFENSQIKLSIDKLNWSTKLVKFCNNKEGLPKIYNKFITEEYKNHKIIFVHDDVLIEDLFFEEKIKLAFEKYDIVGLAGCKKCKITSPVPAWHLMCDQQDAIGEVAHSKDKKHWTTVFGLTDSRALILDGLFLAVDINKLLETGTKFDENFTFHHYDISFCLRANQNKLRMGVYPIKVTHFGLGDSMRTQEWVESAKKFKSLYQ
jgi:GT2 family glycosyltransferase